MAHVERLLARSAPNFSNSFNTLSLKSMARWTRSSYSGKAAALIPVRWHRLPGPAANHASSGSVLAAHLLPIKEPVREKETGRGNGSDTRLQGLSLCPHRLLTEQSSVTKKRHS
jgi:hypothetical protein